MKSLGVREQKILSSFLQFRAVDKYILKCFYEFDKLRNIHRNSGSASIFVIYGDEGMGKKSIIKLYKDIHCKLPSENYSICPILDIKLNHPLSYSSLIKQFLSSLHSFGAAVESKKTNLINLKKKLFHDLQKVKVELIVIHNFHLVENIKNIDIKSSIYQLILEILNELKIPIVAILEGINISEISNTSFINMINYQKYLPLFLPDDQRFADILLLLSKHIGLPKSFEFTDKSIFPVLFVISEGRLITLKRFLDKALEMALEHGENELEIEHLSLAYKELYPNSIEDVFSEKIYKPALLTIIETRNRQIELRQKPTVNLDGILTSQILKKNK